MSVGIIGLSPSVAGKPIKKLTFGAPFKYNSNYPTQYVGSDVWSNTLADDNGIYAASDDMLSGWSGAGTNSNFAISKLSGYTQSMAGTLVNAMSNFGSQGQTGSDSAAYKACGIISVNGALYCFASRQVYGTSGSGWIQPALSSQLIKSTDHGVTWTPQPPSTAQPFTSPMFPSANFAAPFFIQYGKDYQGNTVDNSATYVYAVSSNGVWNNGSDLYLGRVAVANIGNLSAGDWSFWTGGDGMSDANWSSSLASAAPIITNSLKIGMNGVQYLPASGRYLTLQWYYPSIAAASGNTTSDTIWDIYEAPQPWGPWTKIQSNEWTPLGLYNPNIMPASLVHDGGVTAMITSAGDYTSQDPASGDYTLILVPVTIESGGGGSTTTFDPSNLGANISLSNGNLTETNTSTGATWSSARSITSHSTGKFYNEFVNTVFNGEGNAFGIINSSGSLSSYLTADNNSFGYFGYNGGWQMGSGASGTYPTFGAGAICQMAVDFGAQLIWVTFSGGNWNNSGTANPATGTGGLSISTLAGGPYFAAANTYGNSTNSSMTANFGPSYAYTPPVGFGNW